MTPKLIAASGILLALVALCYVIDSNGYNRAIREQQETERAQLKADAVAVKEVKQQAEVREKVIYKTKEVIRNVPATDCIDLPMPDTIERELYTAYRAATRSKAD